MRTENLEVAVVDAVRMNKIVEIKFDPNQLSKFKVKSKKTCFGSKNY